MIYGPTNRLDPVDGAVVPASGDIVLVAHDDFAPPPEGSRLGTVLVWCDGNGPGGVPQKLRPIAREADGRWVAGEAIEVANGFGPGWVHLPFSAPPLVATDGEPFAGVWSGPGSSVQIGLDAAGAGSIAAWSSAWSLAGLPTDPVPGAVTPGTASIVVFAAQPWPFADVPDGDLASLPFPIAQERLALGVGPDGKPFDAVVGWHSTTVDERTGSFAIARTGGPLAEYVGERLRLTVAETGRSVVVYLHDEQDFGDVDDEDLSVARRPALALGLLSAASWRVTCEVLV